MQLHIEESFSTSSSILNIFAYSQKRPNYNLEQIFSVVIAYAKWRVSFLCKQTNKKNLKVVCDWSTAFAIDVLNVFLNVFI